MRSSALALLALGLLLTAPAQAQRAAVLPGSALPEFSGVAHSLRDASVWWAHNDSGDGPALYRLSEQGDDLGQVTVPAARAVDWEDVAAFQSDSGPALLVADTGDNFTLRNTVTLYAVRDPGRGDDVALLWRLDFRYADGPRDCEAVAVDPLRREILLLTKSDRPRRLYRLPLPKRSAGEVQTAELLGTVETLPARVLERPTGMDISGDGRRLAVISNRNLYLYRASPDGWLSALNRPPVVVHLPLMPQAEAVAFDTLAGRAMVGSEGHPPRFAMLALPP